MSGWEDFELIIAVCVLRQSRTMMNVDGGRMSRIVCWKNSYLTGATISVVVHACAGHVRLGEL